MKKLFYPMLFFALVLSSCSNEQEEIRMDNSNTSLKSTTITLHLNQEDKKTLILTDNNGLKSSAIEYTSIVEIGDTIYWKLEKGSPITSIVDIVVVTSDCGEENLFKDGIIFNEDKTECYGVISEKAHGSTKYNIKFKYDDKEFIDDPEIDVKPPED